MGGQKEDIEALNEEQFDLILRFVDVLIGPTLDGGQKRAAGQKDPWYEESLYSHWAAGMRHAAKATQIDSDSGKPHAAHAAWRFAAVAAILMGNIPKENREEKAV